MDGGGNPVPKPAPSELAEHLTSVEHSLRPKYPNEDERGDPVPKPKPSELAEHSTSVEHSAGPRYPMPDDKSGRRVCFYDSQTVSDLLVDLRADGGGNPVPKPAPSELAEHSTSVENSLRPLQAEPIEHPTDTPHGVVGVSDNQPVSEPRQSDNQEIRKSASVRTPRGVVEASANQPVSELGRSDNQTIRQLASVRNQCQRLAPSEIVEQPRSRGRLLPETDRVPRPPPVALLRVVSESRQSEDPARMDGPEDTGSHVESDEAMVRLVQRPWFLTGWAHDVEIEFMIDTGCQVTILSATVFQRMCTVNQAVRSALQPCRRRLVSADSSPLMVQGQMELDIVFPGLGCTMMFVVANIGSDGLLGTEALQSYLPHQLDLRTGQLWADGWMLRCSCTNSD